MRILINTGIYPPKIGGPAQYAKSLKEAFIKGGHSVEVKTFLLEDYLPTGIKHVFFFLKILPTILTSDFVLALDTFSVGLPSVLAGKILGKKVMIRTGGDFLWEQYVERTGKKVLFRNFYIQEKDNLNFKERIIFKLTRWALQNTSKIVFSTEWQRGIFIQAYGLDTKNTAIVENYYGPKEGDFPPQDNIFVASSRNLVWKNLDMAKAVFNEVKSASLFLNHLPFNEFMNKIRNSYAIIQVSLGDISPNLVLDAIRHDKPFVCTREVGIFDRIKDIGIFVDPLNKKEVENAVVGLLDKAEYEKWRQRVKSFNFIHTWEEMAGEYLELYKSIVR